MPVAAPALALVATGGSIVSADRFKKSGYGKVITDQIKQVFKVEIDQAKKDEQVAEITQSQFFKDLQKKKDQFRVSKKEISTKEPSPPAEISAGSAEPQNAVTVEEQNNHSAIEAQAEKGSQNVVNVEEQNNHSAIETEADGELSYLQAKARQMRQRKSADKSIKEPKNQDLRD